ncbi:MAG: SPOR domain-containing protein [Bacteroidetes bacterium]|nr:SPOR domain-containing protein [Bacteroidota bacterium]
MKTLFLFCFIFSINLLSQNKSIDSLKDGDQIILEDFEKSFSPILYDHSFKILPNRMPTNILDDEITGTSEVIKMDTVRGFRIQLITTEDYNQALKLKSYVNILDSLINIYVLFDAPNHKVRIGNFKTRSEANLYLSNLKSSGFNDAWIVQDRIIIERKIKK